MEGGFVGQVMGEVLPLALAITISPIPIVAQIMLLLTDHPKPNATGYLAGFVLGLGTLLVVVVAAAATWNAADPGAGRSPAASWTILVLGVLFVGAAIRKYAARPRPGDDPAMPGWMSRVESLTPRRALVLGAAVGALNPKNLVVVLPAAAGIAVASLGLVPTFGAAAAFVAVAAIGVAVPLLVMVFMGDRAGPLLQRWKDWLARNNAVVMAALYLVIGLVLAGQAAADLAS